MKKQLLFLFALIITFSINKAKAQSITIINAAADDFEQWSPDPANGAVKDPNNGSNPAWQTLNPFTAGFFGPSPQSAFQDSTTVHSGHYSCKLLSVVLVPNSYSIASAFLPHDTAGLMLIGTITLAPSPNIIPGIPFPHRIDTVYFWYQYTPANNSVTHKPDTAFCQVLLTQAHNSLGGGYLQMNAQATWKEAKIPITYTQAGTPDTMDILVSSSSFYAPVPNSVLIIDGVRTNLEWPYSVNNVSTSTTKVDVYPNPSSTEVNFRITGENAYSVNIFDITGKKVGAYGIRNNAATINTESYSSGLYIYQLADEHGNLMNVGKFSVVR